VASEYTIARRGEDAFYLVSAGAWHAYDSDMILKAVEEKRGEFGDIQLAEVTSQRGVFALAGPKARDVLKALAVDAQPETVFSNKRFPWLSVRDVELGMCPTVALRVSYTGSLGWELHHPMEMQNYLFDRLMEVGEPLGLKLCGSRAMNWLRQEKSYRAWGAELGRDATPLEAGLERFVDSGREFRGKAAMEETGIRSACVTLLVDGPDNADPWGREALYDGDTRVGRLTSGGWSVSLGRQIGMGYVVPDRAAPGTRLAVKMLDRLWPAEVGADSPWDPENLALRADG
jgi:dimethylglycine dehydrogenase